MWEGNLESESARRCLYLVAKHAPRLLAVGMATEAAEKAAEEERLVSMTPQQIKLNRYRENARIQKRRIRAMETPEQREHRLKLNRERIRAAKAKRKAACA